MPTTSKVVVELHVNGDGLSARNRFEQTNTTGLKVAFPITVGTGISSATTVSNPINAKYMLLYPASSNTDPYRITQSTAEVGVLYSSRGFSMHTFPESTVASTWYVYTTGTRGSSMRVVFV